MELNDYMTATEFSKEINRKYNTIMRWLRKGWIKGAILQKVGNDELWFIPKTRVKDYEEWNPTMKRGKRGKAKKSATKQSVKSKSTKKGR
jgi:hypothetical protein